VTLAGILFALVVWGSVLCAIYREAPLRFSIPLFLLAGVLVTASSFAVKDFQRWGTGLSIGLALAVAVFAGAMSEKRRKDKAR
jgi:NhaP-type Na+/H+ or K+/H+ antiporter